MEKREDGWCVRRVEGERVSVEGLGWYTALFTGGGTNPGTLHLTAAAMLGHTAHQIVFKN